MSVSEVTKRILSDAETESAAIIADAEQKAAKLLAEATARAENVRQETEADVAQKRRVIMEKRAADARLDSAKILLGEKRKVVNTVYDEAHSRLLELPKERALGMIARLLEEYAEEGDEIVFAKSFAFADDVKILPIVGARQLKIAKSAQEFSGGIRLVGKTSDKDLSYGALLAADSDRYQADLAKEIFK